MQTQTNAHRSGRRFSRIAAASSFGFGLLAAVLSVTPAHLALAKSSSPADHSVAPGGWQVGEQTDPPGDDRGPGNGPEGFGPQGGRPGMAPMMQAASVSHMPFHLLVSGLNLTEEQQGKIAVVLLEARDANQPIPGGQRGPQAGRSSSGGQAADQAVQKQVEALLSTDQASRLKTLIGGVRTLQAAGVPSIAVEKLNLTDQQWQTLAEAAPAPPTGQDQRPSAETMQRTLHAARAAVKSALTADQETQIEAYLSLQTMRQSGGPGFGGPGDNGGPGGAGPDGPGPGGFGGPGDGNGPPPAGE